MLTNSETAVAISITSFVISLLALGISCVAVMTR